MPKTKCRQMKAFSEAFMSILTAENSLHSVQKPKVAKSSGQWTVHLNVYLRPQKLNNIISKKEEALRELKCVRTEATVGPCKNVCVFDCVECNNGARVISFVFINAVIRKTISTKMLEN